jgi:hypothetical protein
MARTFSLIGAPPGSRVTMHAIPFSSRPRRAASTWVLLPHPSMPSKVTNNPFILFSLIKTHRRDAESAEKATLKSENLKLRIFNPESLLY